MTDRDRERSRVKYTYENTFDENSPRPPVPGEESAPQMEWGRHKTPSPTFRKYYYTNETYASMGCEAESGGRSRSSSRQERGGSRTPLDDPSPPSCLRWAFSLHQLLEDRDGVELFGRYLQSEGPQHADSLYFWLACKGLRKQNEPERAVKAIYKHFFQKSCLPISSELRREVSRQVKSSTNFEPPVALFDKAQTEIEHLINNTTYPNFLKSDMYLNYVQSTQNPVFSSGEFSSESSSSSSSVSTRDLTNLASGVGPLPTLHEDVEFVPSFCAPLIHTPGTACVSTGYHTPNVGGPVGLTRDMLLVTQERRAMDIRPKPETFAGMFVYRRGLGAHAAYNSYNPVSRQDSELQSLSSHSESDKMSYTDSSVDGKSLSRDSRRQSAIKTRQVQELAAKNKETNMHQTVIPRTQRVDHRQYQSMDPKKYADTFAPILIERLEKVKREQESQDLLNRKLMEGHSMNSLDEKVRMNDVQSRELANAIREKLQVDDDNDQDILDQHVSRVFSDLTPGQSPGVVSPRPHSPTKTRWAQDPRLRRKDKDVFSTFSSDSGNVHDYAESFDHKMNMIKSKSMPEYAEDRFVRGSSRRSSSKKTLTDLTDSGVSVVSDTPPVGHGAVAKDSRFVAWIMESDRGGRGTTHTHSELSGKHGRHRKTYNGSRSSSLERNSSTSSVGPAQPFVADPNMPPLPPPDTAVRLEEARRRLKENLKMMHGQRSSNKYFSEMAPQSSQSTLRKSRNSKAPPVQAAPVEDVTVVVFSFCDEKLPYRTKISGRQITLKQFKEYLPKKGNYRYFFKTECEELDNQVIQEEVSNDSDVVPLWEGKIMAQVRATD